MPGTTRARLYLDVLAYLRQHPAASDAELCAALGLHPLFDVEDVIRPARQSLAADGFPGPSGSAGPAD